MTEDLLSAHDDATTCAVMTTDMFGQHRIEPTKALRYGGIAAYICVGIPLFSDSFRPNEVATGTVPYLGWLLSYLTFGFAYTTLAKHLTTARQTNRTNVLLLIVLNVSAFGVGYFLKTGLTVVLLMLIAGVLPWILPLYGSLLWAVLQNYSLIPIFLRREGFTWTDVIVQSTLYVGFTGFTYIVSLIAKQQLDSRERLHRLFTELRATRALLDETAKLNERMRISRDLHDVVGHHLTALNLNLEAARHLTAGPSAIHIERAHSTAKNLLHDVRDVVSDLRDAEEIDIASSLRALVKDPISALNVHLQIQQFIVINSTRIGLTVLRCVQETITNAARHSSAKNLWLTVIVENQNRLKLVAYDDGKGSNLIREGNGLKGMRERIDELNGTMNVSSGMEGGFNISITIPLTSGN